MKNNFWLSAHKIFFVSVAWSWCIFGACAIIVEVWRPDFVGSVIPLWFIFMVAVIAGFVATLLKNKK